MLAGNADPSASVVPAVSAEPTVSVVVPVRDAAEGLRALVGALAAQRGAPPFELVVADDGSTDDVAAALVSPPFPVTVVGVGHGDGRWAAGHEGPARAAGPGAARNAAVAAARGALLAFTDADCLPGPGWLAALSAALTAAPCVAQGPIRVPAGDTAGPFDRTVQRPGASGLCETANLGVRRADVLAVGGFPAGERPLGGKEMGEDVGLGVLLRRRGLRVAWCPRAVVVHGVERRGAVAAARERVRAGGFCGLTRRWPELRSAVLHRRAFLGSHRPALDLALLGLAGTVAGRRSAAGPPVRALAAACVLPYVRDLDRRSRGAGRRRQPGVAAGLVAGDLAETAGLAAGSLLTRTPVL